MTKLTIAADTGDIILQEEINADYYEAEVTAKITADGEILQSSCVVSEIIFFQIS